MPEKNTETIARTRGPAEDPRPLAERARSTLDALPAALAKVAKCKPLVRPRSSTVLSVLESRRSEILRLLGDGYSANSLAHALKAEGIGFSVEALRIAIKRIQHGSDTGAGSRKSDSASRHVAHSHATPPPQSSSTSSTGGFDRLVQRIR